MNPGVAMTVLALVTAGVAAVRGLWSPCGLSMLSSLNPVSEAARGNRFAVTAGWYLAGATAGGLALGGGCAAGAAAVHSAGLPAAMRWALVVMAALVGVASDTGVLRRLVGRSLPVHPRQVDERWMTRYRRWIYASGYGVQIGCGLATYVMTAAVYLTVVLAVLTASPLAALTVGAVFGLVRGLTVLTAASSRTPAALRAAHRWLARRERASLAAAVAVQAGVAVAGGAAAVKAAADGPAVALPAVIFTALVVLMALVVVRSAAAGGRRRRPRRVTG